MTILIGKHQEGISLNPIEYAFDDNGQLLEFDSKNEAKAFLKIKFPEFDNDALEDSFVYVTKNIWEIS